MKTAKLYHGPVDTRRMCPHCRAFITTKDRVCPYCNETVGSRATDRRDPAPILGGLIPHAHFNTILILVINAGLYIASTIFSMQAGNGEALQQIDGNTLIRFGAKVNIGYIAASGEWWRLVTAGFLHGGILHILMNSWVLFSVGSQVEELYGASRMWTAYFVATVLGFLASSWWSGSISVGASAGLMGMIGAMIALGMRDRSRIGDAIRGQYVSWVVWMLLIGLWPGLHIDNAAHIGGLAGGFGIAYLAGQQRHEGSWTENVWRAASWFCVLLTVVSFAEWLLWFRRLAQ